jgi:hypothetical protein
MLQVCSDDATLGRMAWKPQAELARKNKIGYILRFIASKKTRLTIRQNSPNIFFFNLQISYFCQKRKEFARKAKSAR